MSEGVLFGVHPNPFEEETMISFTGDSEYQPHTVEIFSADGACVRIFSLPAGIPEVTWDGKGKGGNELSSGIYYIRVTSGRLYSVKKVIRM